MDAAGPATQPFLVGGHPAWVVLLAGALAVIVVVWLLARAFRLLAGLLALGIIGVATWLAWEHLFG